jgi:hypothetical protein
MITDRIKAIVLLLEGVAEGDIDPDQALRDWGDVDQDQDQLFASAWHELIHFVDDDDIREKDEEYDSYQRQLLKDYAKRILEKYS